MLLKIARPLALAALLGLAAVHAAAAQATQGGTAQAVIAQASRAMGIDQLNSIHIYGSGANYNLGQNNNADGPWPRSNLNDFNRWIDFAQPSTRATAVTWQPPLSGGASVQGAFNQFVAPTSTNWGQLLEIWTTPWGFLKGAAANGAAARVQTIDGVRQQVVTWSPPQKSPAGLPYRLVGYIGPDNLVRKVETWVEHPLLGDLKVEVAFSNYRDVNGLKYPTTVVQTRAGFPTTDLQILSVKANPADIRAQLTPPTPQGPPGGGGGTGAAPTLSSLQLAPGVWRIRNGGNNALAIEFADHILIYEPASGSETQTAAVLAETRRVIPGKPVRYGVISHHHFDHTGGLPGLVAEGITIVAHESNRGLLERGLNAPRTLAADSMTRSGRKPVFTSIVGDKRVFQDATRTFEVHQMKGNSHADGLTMGYLPKEKILITADVFSFYATPPSPPIDRTVAFLDNIERLGLQPEQILSVHTLNPDRPATMADLRAQVGR